jgi:hypothetical protein
MYRVVCSDSKSKYLHAVQHRPILNLLNAEFGECVCYLRLGDLRLGVLPLGVVGTGLDTERSRGVERWS